MAKYERRLRGNFDSLLNTLDKEILGRSISATFQGENAFTDHIVKIIEQWERA